MEGGIRGPDAGFDGKDRTDREACRVVWREGKPAERILEVREEEELDLLLLGALRKEKLYAYYLGTLARWPGGSHAQLLARCCL